MEVFVVHVFVAHRQLWCSHVPAKQYTDVSTELATKFAAYEFAFMSTIWYPKLSAEYTSFNAANRRTFQSANWYTFQSANWYTFQSANSCTFQSANWYTFQSANRHAF